MNTQMIKRIAVSLVSIMAVACLLMALSACGVKEIKVNIVDAGATSEVTVREGATVSDILKAADIEINEGDEVSPALDTKIEGENQTITIERMNNVVIAVDGNNIEVAVLGGTVQDALAKAEVTLGDGDTIDIDAETPLENDMLITVERAPKVSVSTNDSSSGQSDASASEPAAKSVVSRTKVPNCDDPDHGYYEVAWSDGSMTYEEY